MPLWLLRAYVEAVPRLQAGEALQQYQIAAVGGGNVKKEAARRVIRGWQRAARKGQRSSVKKLGSKEAAAALRIAYIEEKPDV